MSDTSGADYIAPKRNSRRESRRCNTALSFRNRFL